MFITSNISKEYAVLTGKNTDQFLLMYHNFPLTAQTRPVHLHSNIP